jgi:hypothetical protein
MDLAWADLLPEHPASPLLAEAEEPARGAGLRPWPGADRPGSQ